jgi:hypothetical protein
LAVEKIKVKPSVFSSFVLRKTSQSNSQLLEGGGAPNSSQFRAKAAGAAEVSKKSTRRLSLRVSLIIHEFYDLLTF